MSINKDRFDKNLERVENLIALFEIAKLTHNRPALFQTLDWI